MSLKFFISGKITGLDEREYKANFAETEQRLREAGITNIFNPAREIPFGTPWGAAMQVCFKEIEQSDVVVFMQNWLQSLGSRREWEHANRLKKIIRFDTPQEISEIKRNLSKFQKV